MNQPTRLLPSVVEAIGETPLVELERLTRGLSGRILAKLEYLNPGYSKKDRIARQIVEDAEANGLLHLSVKKRAHLSVRPDPATRNSRIPITISN